MSEPPEKLTDAQKLGYILGGNVDEAYFTALGRFMDQFSIVEALLYHLVVAELRLDLKLAATVLSGLKAAECIASLKRMYESRGTPIPATLQAVFEHVGTLTTARNEIVHFGSYGPGVFERVVSTELKAHTAKKAKRWVVSADTLTDMYWDAEKATWALIGHMSRGIQPDPEGASSKALKRAWLYRYPSNPTSSGKKQGQKGGQTGHAPKGQPGLSHQ